MARKHRWRKPIFFFFLFSHPSSSRPPHRPSPPLPSCTPNRAWPPTWPPAAGARRRCRRPLAPPFSPEAKTVLVVFLDQLEKRRARPAESLFALPGAHAHIGSVELSGLEARAWTTSDASLSRFETLRTLNSRPPARVGHGRPLGCGASRFGAPNPRRPSARSLAHRSYLHQHVPSRRAAGRDPPGGPAWKGRRLMASRDGASTPATKGSATLWRRCRPLGDGAESSYSWSAARSNHPRHLPLHPIQQPPTALRRLVNVTPEARR